MPSSPPSRALRTAAVFGASGAIGAALTAALIARGEHDAVYAGARRSGGEVTRGTIPFAFDLTDESSIAAAARLIDPAPDLVIVATGMLHDADARISPEKTLRTLSGDAMARSFAINAIGPALIGKHMIPRLPRDRRTIFACLSARVGSIADNRLGGWHSYRAGKAALNMLIRNFAIELGRTHPLAVVAALHPGTVDSALSEPFQRGVPAGKLFTPRYSAQCLLDVMDRLSPADSGGLFAWDGARLPD